MILASKSPRRLEILNSFGFEIEVLSKEILEESDKKEIWEQIEDIAYKKAYEIAVDKRNYNVLASDTVVVFSGKILGKPKMKKRQRQCLGFYLEKNML